MLLPVYPCWIYGGNLFKEGSFSVAVSILMMFFWPFYGTLSQQTVCRCADKDPGGDR